MAVTTNHTDLIEAPYPKSMKNNPGQIATESTELLQVVIRMIRKFYSIAARVNPRYFASTSDVTFPGDGLGWARPEGAESVYRIEAADGSEIVVVPEDDKEAESGMAAVFRKGKAYYSADGSDPDDTADTLTFWYSKRPTDPGTLAATIDSLWEEAYNELVILEVALYLANKDGRSEEVGQLASDRDEWLRMFIMFLEHETVNERRRFGHIRRFNTESLVPLNDILIGGSTVKLDRGGN